MARAGARLAPMAAFRGLSADPISELFELQRGINRLFDQSFGSPRQDVEMKAWMPPVDVYEDENAFLIKVELPEVSKDDVKVNLNDNTLSISGERRVENEDNRDNYHRIERTYGQFYRSFTLPPNVTAESIQAQFKDGVLRLTLPKKEEAKPKQIDVKVQ